MTEAIGAAAAALRKAIFRSRSHISNSSSSSLSSLSSLPSLAPDVAAFDQQIPAAKSSRPPKRPLMPYSSSSSFADTDGIQQSVMPSTTAPSHKKRMLSDQPTMLSPPTNQTSNFIIHLTVEDDDPDSDDLDRPLPRCSARTVHAALRNVQVSTPAISFTRKLPSSSVHAASPNARVVSASSSKPSASTPPSVGGFKRMPRGQTRTGRIRHPIDSHIARLATHMANTTQPFISSSTAPASTSSAPSSTTHLSSTSPTTTARAASVPSSNRKGAAVTASTTATYAASPSSSSRNPSAVASSIELLHAGTPSSSSDTTHVATTPATTSVSSSRPYINWFGTSKPPPMTMVQKMDAMPAALFDERDRYGMKLWDDEISHGNYIGFMDAQYGIRYSIDGQPSTRHEVAWSKWIKRRAEAVDFAHEVLCTDAGRQKRLAIYGPAKYASRSIESQVLTFLGQDVVVPTGWWVTGQWTGLAVGFNSLPYSKDDTQGGCDGRMNDFTMPARRRRLDAGRDIIVHSALLSKWLCI